jgi:hypothetical protein
VNAPTVFVTDRADVLPHLAGHVGGIRGHRLNLSALFDHHVRILMSPFPLGCVRRSEESVTIGTADFLECGEDTLLTVERNDGRQR